MKYFMGIIKKNVVLGSLIFFIWLTVAVSLRFSNNILSLFPTIQTWQSIVHFNTAWNNFGGVIYLDWIENITGDGVFLTWSNINCSKKMKWIYFNNQRWKRFWPLDQASLVKLQSMDSSYSNLTISWWFYTNCASWRNSTAVAWQITHNWRWKIFKLIAGVQMNTNNTYTLSYSNSLQYTWWILSGKIFDNYWWIANIFSTWSQGFQTWSDIIITWSSPQTVIQNNVWWGWWASIVKDICKYSSTKKNLPGANDDWVDFSPSYYDKTCWIPPSLQSDNTIVDWNIEWSSYSAELNKAYLYAYRAAITTVWDINRADMMWLLLRKHMAKMISQYAINVLKMTPNEDIQCNFTDMWDEDIEMQESAKTACQLWLMWLKSDWTPSDKFKPKWIVTRAQFGTALSRLLYWNTHNAADSKNWYWSHLKALRSSGIMNNISKPSISEKRWYVMLMLMRAWIPKI